MAKFNIKLDARKIEKEIKDVMTKRIKEIDILKKEGDKNMKILNKNSEIMLNAFLEKYNKTHNYTIEGEVDEFPKHFQFSIKKIMEDLEYNGYITSYDVYISGTWTVTLTPEAIEYYEKKGSRVELFEELMDNEKELLKKLIEVENNEKDITEYLKNILENDKNNIKRGVIKSLTDNGLLKVFWADDTVYYANLTQSGRTYYEREEKHNKNIEKLASRTYNIGTVTASGGNVFIGDVTNSQLNINNSISNIEKEIEDKCESEDEKAELKELLDEVKEIAENIQESGNIARRKKFFEKMSEHLAKHGWFYGAVIDIIGQAAINRMGGM